MCSEPILMGDQLVSCRNCDDCINTRKNTWVARCMAEKAMSKHTYMVTLTLADNADGSRPVAARVFDYRQVQDFLKVLRTEYQRKFLKTGEIRFIACGERGSKGSKRLHWHLIIFSQQDIARLGSWTAFHDRQVHDVPTLDVRYDWSLWPHGFCHLAKPDQEGMSYVLKYVLGDQFSGEKSKRKNRFIRSDNYRSSLFRQSLKPPIGVPLILERIASYSDRGLVPPDTNIRVPDYSGFWFLTGPQRVEYLNALHLINKEHYAQHGRNCDGWRTLLYSVTKLQKNETDINNDLEILNYGKVEKSEAPSEEEARSDFERLALSIRSTDAATRTKHIVRRCGHIVPCEQCAINSGPEARHYFEAQAEAAYSAFVKTQPPEVDDWAVKRAFEQAQLAKAQPSEACGLKDTAEVRQAFANYKGVSQLQNSIGGRQTLARGSKGI